MSIAGIPREYSGGEHTPVICVRLKARPLTRVEIRFYFRL